jgi:sugar fermentation stimulation protein A
MSLRVIDFSEELKQAVFLKRYKRFFSDVYLAGDALENSFAAHCANSGSMKSCIEKQTDCLISDSKNLSRKLRFSLEALKLDDGWACLNTMRANQVLESLMKMRKSLKSESFLGAQSFLDDFSEGEFRSEAKFNSHSRFDGLIKTLNQQHWIEVKSVSLRVSETEIAFPDAVTERGTKHLSELKSAVTSKEKGTLIFAVMRGADVSAPEISKQFRIAKHIDSKYYDEALIAQAAGVQFRILVTAIDKAGIAVRGYFPFYIDST